MQLPRLPSGVPRYVLNTGLAVFILSIVLWSINALSIGSIDILRGKSTQPLQLGDTSDEAHNLNSTLDPNLESHSNHHLVDPNIDQELDPVDPDRNQPQIEDGHEHQTDQSSSTAAAAAAAAASNATATTTDRRCNAIANPPDVAIIVKTGANVLYEKVPFQLLSSWLCADDPLIFSDLATTLGPYQVYDVLDNVTDVVKQSSDFDYYRRLQDYKKYGQDVRKLRSEGESGWTLDKYKFIPMLKKTWTMRPNHDWYVFLEGDTYLMWTNMLLWLQQLNPHDLHYLGEQTYVNNEGFAHGGSGFIISRTAMAKVLDDDPDITHRYDFIAMNEYYGDYVLAKALKEKGVDLGLYKPMLQGEPPSTLRYGPGRYENERAWCQPLITLHHVTPLDVDAVWQFEQQREDLTQPILFADMYRYFMAAHLPEDGDELLLEDWDNFSEDAQLTGPESEEEERPIPPEEMTPAQQAAHESAEKCAAACAEYPRCMQFSYEASEQKCSYSFSYRLGQRRDPQDNDDKKYTSGWIRSKIDRDIMEHPCESVEWRGFDTE